MDDPITDVVVVTNVSDCPHDYTVISTTPCGYSANIWEKVFGGRAGERYICFTKTGGQRDSVVEDMIIPPPSQKYLRKGYRAITETPDGEEPLRHKQLVLKRSSRAECTEAIVDIVVYRSKDTPAHNLRKLAKVNDLLICVRSAKIKPLGKSTAPAPKPANVSAQQPVSTPVQKPPPVEENVQVQYEEVVESSQDVTAMLDRMDLNQHSPTGSTQPTTYNNPQSSAPPIPATSTYSMPATTDYTNSTATAYSSSYPTSYSDTITSYSSTQQTNTYPSSGTTYSDPNAGYSTANTQSTYPSSGSNPNAGHLTTNSQTTYPSSGSAYSSQQGAYPSSGFTYSSPSAPPSSGSTYSNPNAPYSGYTQGSTTYPQSGSSYSNPSAPYSNPTNSYSNASYSNASYSGSSSSYSANPYSNPGTPYSGSSYSNPQYSGYPSQPNPQYQTGYPSGSYPPTTTQSYGVYPPPSGTYGGANQPGYPPTTNKHFSGDIGF